MMDWRTWAIDETSVENSPHTWEDMFYKQLRIPGLFIALVLSGIYLYPSEWLLGILVGIPFTLYLMWPAYACWTYWRQDEQTA